MKSRRLCRKVAISLMSAGPAGGFLFGLLNAGDPDPNPVGRFFYACLMAVQTPLHAGFPPQNAADTGQTSNVWPYIAVSFLLILGSLVGRDWILNKKTQ
jgi:hypothetical protein